MSNLPLFAMTSASRPSFCPTEAKQTFLKTSSIHLLRQEDLALNEFLCRESFPIYLEGVPLPKPKRHPGESLR